MNINYEQYNNYSSKDLKNIFGNQDISSLSDYEKRKMIFNYLSDNFKYNLSEYLLLSYKRIKYNHYKINNRSNLYDCIVNHTCLCNSISYYYMLLLSKVNIDACVVCTDNGFPIKHALNIVYNKESDTYSFDDISCSIIYKYNKEAFFDYDLDDAKMFMQGGSVICHSNVYWLRLPNIYIYSLIDDYNEEYDNKAFNNLGKYEIPERIISYKKSK